MTLADKGSQPCVCSHGTPRFALQILHCTRLMDWLRNMQRQLRRDYPLALPPAPVPAATVGEAQEAEAQEAGPEAAAVGLETEDTPMAATSEAEAAADDAAPEPLQCPEPEVAAARTVAVGAMGPPARQQPSSQTAGLPDRLQLLAFVVRLRRCADRSLEAELEASSGCISLATARLQLHALLSELLSGLYLPPVRMASLCTLMVPGELSCQQQGCGRRGCRGNNMVEEAAGLVLELSHHKTERYHRQHPPLRLLLPREIATSVRTFMQHARPVLLLRATREADLDTPYLLVSDSGTPFAGLATQFAVVWREIQREHSAPWPPFPPQRLRHVHATAAYQDLVQEVADRQPQLAGDARVMGNSVRMWERHYIQRQGSILAQASVQRLADWRARGLARLSGQGRAQQQHQAVPAAAAVRHPPPMTAHHATTASAAAVKAAGGRSAGVAASSSPAAAAATVPVADATRDGLQPIRSSLEQERHHRRQPPSPPRRVTPPQLQPWPAPRQPQPRPSASPRPSPQSKTPGVRCGSFMRPSKRQRRVSPDGAVDPEPTRAAEVAGGGGVWPSRAADWRGKAMHLTSSSSEDWEEAEDLTSSSSEGEWEEVKEGEEAGEEREGEEEWGEEERGEDEEEEQGEEEERGVDRGLVKDGERGLDWVGPVLPEQGEGWLDEAADLWGLPDE